MNELFSGYVDTAGNFRTSRTGDICARNHQNNEFSVLANPRTEVKRSERKQILACIMGFRERTCEEVEDHTGLSHQSCSARISELKRDGLITVVGKRKTRSGCNAAVYRLSPNMKNKSGISVSK